MARRSVTLWLGALLLLPGLLALASSAQQHHDPVEHAMTAKEASELFAERCSTCHVAPDLAYATDRAWVQQVNETA